MPKPSRRERRRLAEKGQSAPRRAAPASLPHGASMEPRERAHVSAAAPVDRSAIAAPALSAVPGEYTHVKADLVRIAVLAGSLIAGMIALRFILPQ